METKKRALFAFEDKRNLHEDGISLLAFGHREMSGRVEDIEHDAENDVLLSQADAIRHYEKSLGIS